MKKFFHILDIGVATINRNIAVFGVAAGVLLAFTNAVLRYVFGTSLTWAGELTNYLFIWAALFGAAYGFKKGIHIQVTILLAKFPPKIAKGFMILAHTITFAYLGFMSYLGISLVEVIMEMEEISIDLNIPMWIPNLVIPVAFAAAAFRAGEKIYEVSVMDPNKVIRSNEEEIIHDSIDKN